MVPNFLCRIFFYAKYVVFSNAHAQKNILHRKSLLSGENRNRKQPLASSLNCFMTILIIFILSYLIHISLSRLISSSVVVFKFPLNLFSSIDFSCSVSSILVLFNLTSNLATTFLYESMTDFYFFPILIWYHSLSIVITSSYVSSVNNFDNNFPDFVLKLYFGVGVEQIDGLNKFTRESRNDPSGKSPQPYSARCPTKHPMIRKPHAAMLHKFSNHQISQLTSRTTGSRFAIPFVSLHLQFVIINTSCIEANESKVIYNVINVYFTVEWERVSSFVWLA